MHNRLPSPANKAGLMPGLARFSTAPCRFMPGFHANPADALRAHPVLLPSMAGLVALCLRLSDER